MKDYTWDVRLTDTVITINGSSVDGRTETKTNK